MVVVALPIVVVVTAWEATTFLLFFTVQRCIISRSSTTVLGRLHPKSRYRDWGDAALEVVDDIIIGDIGDGGSCVEEALDIGPDRLALLLLAHGQGVSSSYSV
jgi:hypothetical protein